MRDSERGGETGRVSVERERERERGRQRGREGGGGETDREGERDKDGPVDLCPACPLTVLPALWVTYLSTPNFNLTGRNKRSKDNQMPARPGCSASSTHSQHYNHQENSSSPPPPPPPPLSQFHLFVYLIISRRFVFLKYLCPNLSASGSFCLHHCTLSPYLFVLTSPIVSLTVQSLTSAPNALHYFKGFQFSHLNFVSRPLSLSTPLHPPSLLPAFTQYSSTPLLTYNLPLTL